MPIINTNASLKDIQLWNIWEAESWTLRSIVSPEGKNNTTEQNRVHWLFPISTVIEFITKFGLPSFCLVKSV